MDDLSFRENQEQGKDQPSLPPRGTKIAGKVKVTDYGYKPRFGFAAILANNPRNGEFAHSENALLLRQYPAKHSVGCGVYHLNIAAPVLCRRTVEII